MNSPSNLSNNIDGKVLLVGVTGGTGVAVVKGFLQQQVANLRAMTRHLDSQRSSHLQLQQAGVELVEANLDSEESLAAALAGVSVVYCHATAPDLAKPDPIEIERAKRLAQAAKKANIHHLIYNSAGGVSRNSGVNHIEQKYHVEQAFKVANLPTTMLRSCFFMEEFWKHYTRPSILNGKFPFSIQPNKPLHLLTTQDLGRVAAYIIQHPSRYLNTEIELAGDVLTPQQIAAEFSKVQGKKVIHQEVSPWLFWLLGRKELFKLIQWYRKEGYQADIDALRQEFPGLLTTFPEFLEQTHWSNPDLTYESLTQL